MSFPSHNPTFALRNAFQAASSRTNVFSQNQDSVNARLSIDSRSTDDSADMFEKVYHNPAFDWNEEADDDNNESQLDQSSSTSSQTLANRQLNLYSMQVEESIKESQDSNQQVSEEKKGNKRAPWDKPVTSPDNQDHNISSDWPIQLLKIVVYVVIFMAVLVSSVISTILTLLMTSMTQPDRSIPICLQNVSFYPIEPPLAANESSYSVQYRTTDSVHRVAWLWCLYFATITPSLLAFARSVRICCFKTFSFPSWTTSLTVSPLKAVVLPLTRRIETSS